MSVKQWCSEACSRPLELIIGLCVFAAVAAGGASENTASPALAILFITSLFYLRSWPQQWRELSRHERLVLLGFGFYFFSAVVAYYNVSDQHEYVKHLGRYTRFLVLVPIYLLLSRSDLKLFKYVLAGAIASGAVYFLITLYNISERPGLPAQGGYHHITFGDMAMLNAMFLTAVLATMKKSRVMWAVLVISIMCLLYSSVMSQARGAWLALAFCLPLIFFTTLKQSVVKLRSVVIGVIVLVAIVMVSPLKDLIDTRWQAAVHEVELYESGEQFDTSVGARLAMWDIALDVWKEHPFIGTGPGDYDLDLQAVQRQGRYKEIWVMSSTHNIYFQALATTGAIGLVILCLALVVLPFRFFYKIHKEEPNIAALGGMVVITAFAVFGLTESWMLRSPVIAIYGLYWVTLATEAKKTRGPQMNANKRK